MRETERIKNKQCNVSKTYINREILREKMEIEVSRAKKEKVKK